MQPGSGYLLGMRIDTLLSHRVRIHEPAAVTDAASPAVLLLHSSGLSGRQWRPLMAALGRRALAPSLFGYEESDPLPASGEGALRTDLAVVEALLLAQPEPVDLVGHSYGGALAMRLAVRHPARVRRVVVHEPVCWGVLFSDGDAALIEQISAFLTSSQLLDAAIGGSAVWLQRFVDYWSGPGAWAQMPDPHQQAFLRLGPKVFAEVRDLCLDRTPLSAYTETLGCPVTVTVGRRSPAEERGVCALLAAHLPQATLQELPGGHMAPVSHAAAFIAAAQVALA